MAWFCQRCNDLLWSIGEDYCDSCLEKKREEKLRAEVKKRVQEKNKKIIEEVHRYKEEQIHSIEKKYGTTIYFYSDNFIFVPVLGTGIDGGETRVKRISQGFPLGLAHILPMAMRAELMNQSEDNYTMSSDEIEEASTVRISQKNETYNQQISVLFDEIIELKKAIEELEGIKNEIFR